MYKVDIIEDSISLHGVRLTTFQLRYPRYIHAEMLTHRMFSRNASSSRAIPVAKLSLSAAQDMVKPIRWGLNQAGMQASSQDLEGEKLKQAHLIWEQMAQVCADGAVALSELGLHKQWANRPLEWFSDIQVVLTATEFTNFFALRNHPDAQPEIHKLASMMFHATADSAPVLRGQRHGESSWHLPYVSTDERKHISGPLLPKLSAARCARVSYLTHSGEKPDVEKDLALFNRLVGSEPLHASPIEHQARPAADPAHRSNNFVGWVQYRQIYEQSLV